MSGQTLQISEQGKKVARKALKKLGITQKKLALRLALSEWSVSNFMRGKPVKSENFLELCRCLGLDSEDVVQEYAEPTDISALVEEVRAKVYKDIDYRCGTMRVLDMTKPIGLGQIYTQVNILEKITGSRRLGINELMEACGIEDFERFGLGDIKQEKVPGIEAVQAHNRLMVLGKPGAGKTTFLKYLATQCNQGEKFNGLVPIFVTLKEFAELESMPSLLEYVQSQLDTSKVNNPKGALAKLLEGDSTLILLDGLDEVKQEDARRIYAQIEEFARRAGNCIVVVTCRIAAKEYTFQNFTEVEVADFDEKQIEEFATNWFAERGPAKAKKFIEKINNGARVKELATSPLLLTLLCLLFEDNTDFPSNRYDLYQEGVSVLLKKWDAKHGIKRQDLYKNLSSKRKEDLLSYVAISAFKDGDYFFKQKRLEEQIYEYVQNLQEAKLDEALALDGEDVLKAIEAHHGLLIERAKGVYSFSHLTLQEYFAARSIIKEEPESLDLLTTRVAKKSLNNIFILVANGLPKADIFLLSLKNNTDCMLCNDSKVQAFIKWTFRKSVRIARVSTNNSFRACYFTHALSQIFLRGANLGKDYKFMHELSFEFILPKSIDSNFVVPPSLLIANDNVNLDAEHERISDNLKLDIALENILEIGLRIKIRLVGKSPCEKLDLASWVSVSFFDYINTVKDSANILDTKFYEKLQELIDRLEITNQNIFCNIKWFDDLNEIMRTHRDIGHDWDFNDTQKQLLRDYYYLNKLLLDCLNTDCCVSREVRQEIEDTLLLPVSEIEAYKKAHPR